MRQEDLLGTYCHNPRDAGVLDQGGSGTDEIRNGQILDAP